MGAIVRLPTASLGFGQSSGLEPKLIRRAPGIKSEIDIMPYHVEWISNAVPMAFQCGVPVEAPGVPWTSNEGPAYPPLYGRWNDSSWPSIVFDVLM